MRDAVQEFMSFNREYARRSVELMRFKIERMADNPFAFFRGCYHLFARDVLQRDLIPLPILASDGVEMELVGDIHCENYGTYKAEDGLIHYDIDDFDETTLGRFDVDLCRFAANILLAAQQRKETPLELQVGAVLAGLTSYLETASAILKKAKLQDLDISEKHPGDSVAIAMLIQQESVVKRSKFIDDHTEDKNGKRLIRRSLRKYYNLTEAEVSQAGRLLQDFKTRWQAPEKKGFFDIYDICGRISGIGSMGRHRYVILIGGKDHAEKRNVLLEFKEARPSAYDIFRNRETTPEAIQQRAEKVITCQRLSQAVSSPYLGHALDGAMSFQVREISPHAERVNWKDLKHPAFIDVIKVQAAILARVHVRASTRVQGPTHPLPELADSERFRQRLLAFALGYADIMQRDWARFKAAREELDNVAAWAGS